MDISSAVFFELVTAAARGGREAYCPYSRFPVGAAVLTAAGEIFSGCNVENASYGLTICAERNAIFQAVAHGRGPLSIRAVVVFTPTAAPTAPCGACRQVINEFGPDARVFSVCDGPEVIESRLLRRCFCRRPSEPANLRTEEGADRSMAMIIGEDTPAGTTRIHCPACHTRDVEAQIIEHAEKVMEFAGRSHEHAYDVVGRVLGVQGSALLQDFRTRASRRERPISSLAWSFRGWASSSNSGRSRRFSWRSAPGLGTGVGLIAYFVNRKSSGWPRTASKIRAGSFSDLHVAFFCGYRASAIATQKRH